ncbi:MAG: hypothetical protein ABIG44_07865 [Planctomycetota bacterium]
MPLFVCTYDSREHCEISEREHVLGFHTQNTGTLGSLHDISAGTLVLLRMSSRKDRMVFYGLFRATGALKEVGDSTARIWPDEKRRDRVIYNLRVPVESLCRVPRSLTRKEVLALGWKTRYPPIKPYAWQGYTMLFKGNFLGRKGVAGRKGGKKRCQEDFLDLAGGSGRIWA